MTTQNSFQMPNHEFSFQNGINSPSSYRTWQRDSGVGFRCKLLPRWYRVRPTPISKNISLSPASSSKSHDINERNVPSSTFTASDDNIFDVEVQSTVSSSTLSFPLADTPISKTKKLNHNIHDIISKVRFHQKQKLHFIFGQSKRNSFCQEEKNGSEVLFESQDSQVSLSNEALSCYNQFKTVNFKAFFDQLKTENNFNSEITQDFKIPVFSPVNELTYEKLKNLKAELLNTRSFSVDSSINFLELEFEENVGETLDRNDTIIEGIRISNAPPVSNSSGSLVSPVVEELGLNHTNSSKKINITEQFFGGQEEDCALTECDSVQLTQFCNTSDNESSPSVGAILTGALPTRNDNLVRSRSMLQRVKSVFKTDHSLEEDIGTSSSTSSYSPVSVIVPAMKNHSFILSCTGTITEGRSIDSVYELHQYGDDENTPLDQHNLRDYDASPVPQETQVTLPSPDSNLSSLDFSTTIKFHKFAQLLLYDGSKRLKSLKEREELISNMKRQPYLKNHGSLVLSSALSNNSMSKFKNLRLSKFSKFATVSGSYNSNKKEMTLADLSHYSSNTLGPVKPILRSKFNKNAEVESVRAKYCDDVEVEDFMTFFESHEKKRQENEPLLERVRERQLLTYYSEDGTENDY